MESDIPEPTTQPASFIPTWEDPPVPEEVLNALAYDLARDDSDQPTHELGRFEAEPIEWDSIGTRPPEAHNDPVHEEVADTQVSRLPRLRIVGSGGGPSDLPGTVRTSDGNDGSSTDTYAVEGHSEPGEEDFPDSVAEENLDIPDFRPGVLRRAFASLDEVDVCVLFQQRVSVMRSVPKFLAGSFKNTLSIALEEITRSDDEVNQERGWKLFLMLPRMLLHRPPGGGQIPKAKLVERFRCFVDGEWIRLIAASEQCDEKAAIRRRRATRIVTDDLEKRATRAEMLCHMGELSSARQALEGAALAPGNAATLHQLKDPSRRPPRPREPLPDDVMRHVPPRAIELDEQLFCRNLRSCRRGAAAGPSAMTTEHLRPMCAVICGFSTNFSWLQRRWPGERYPNRWSR